MNFSRRAAFALALLLGCRASSPGADAGALRDAAPSEDAMPEASTPDRGPGDGAAPDVGSDGGTGDGLTEAERAAREDELPRPDGWRLAPSSMGHFAPHRQASTFRAGPLSNDALVQVIDFERDLGKDLGTSPWHLVGTRRYADAPEATTVWGVSLTDLYRIRLEGPRFEAIERIAINFVASSITWNLLGADDGRVYVPDPNGYLVPPEGPCRTTDATLLRFVDDDALGEGARCDGALALDAATLRGACGTEDMLRRGSTGTSLMPTFSGELATVAVFGEPGAEPRAYLVLVEEDLSSVVGCGLLDDTLPTNELAAEPEGEATAFYAATGDAVVKLVWDPGARRVTRRWERELPIRGRTGTTPTLVDATPGDRFVVLVDAPCAVASVVNGLIACDDDVRAGALVAVRRDDDEALAGRAPVITAELPGWLLTVENSPAARGPWVVVANYSGYLPNGLRVPPGGFVPDDGPAAWLTSPDALAEHATGLVALRYRSERERFEVAWSDADTQVSGVPTISGGANRVYGSGAEATTGRTYLYGFRLAADAEGPAGERVLRVDVGAAPFRTPASASGDVIFARGDYGLAPGEAYDGGNNVVITGDRSALIAGGRSLIRVRDPE